MRSARFVTQTSKRGRRFGCSSKAPFKTKPESWQKDGPPLCGLPAQLRAFCSSRQPGFLAQLSAFCLSRQLGLLAQLSFFFAPQDSYEFFSVECVLPLKTGDFSAPGMDQRSAPVNLRSKVEPTATRRASDPAFLRPAVRVLWSLRRALPIMNRTGRALRYRIFHDSGQGAGLSAADGGPTQPRAAAATAALPATIVPRARTPFVICLPHLVQQMVP